MRGAGRCGRAILGVAAALALVSGCAIADHSASRSADPSPTAITSSASTSSSAPGSTARPAATPTGKRLDAAGLQAFLDEYRGDMAIPGAIVGVWTPTDSWVGATGEAGPDHRAISRADHTRVGSLTKTFTATMILQLADEGRLSLDDPISKYVPGLPNGNATLRQLASMTSGIISYTEMGFFDDAYKADPTRAWTPEQLVDAIRRGGALFAPGAATSYSNSNAVLLGVVVEQVTGQAYAAALQQRILSPLGLAQTSFPLGADLPSPYLSGVTDMGDTTKPRRDATHFSPTTFWAAGGMVSTVDDLHRWLEALVGGTGSLVKPETQRARLASVDLTTTPTGTPATPSPPRRYRYGLGMDNDRGWIGHTGELDGYLTIARYNPATRTTAVVIVNSNVYYQGARPSQVIFDELITKIG